MMELMKEIAPQNQQKDFFALLMLKGDIVLAAIFTLAVLQLLRDGLIARWLVLAVWSLASVGVLAALDRGARKVMSGWPSYIPYLFGIYLFFTEGFIRLTYLWKDFSVLNAVLVVMFFVAGNAIATIGYNTVLYAKRLQQSH